MTDLSIISGLSNAAGQGDDLLSLRVLDKADIAQDIHLFTLAHPDGAELPAFAAGAHLLIHTPAGPARRYSLCGDPARRDRYLIAVKREAKGEGGSISMTDDVAPGDTLRVSAPQNYFPLDHGAGRHLLIAGGIGITPMLAMAYELAASQADFQLVYCTRSPDTTAFADELAALGERVRIHHDFGDPAQSLDIRALLAQRQADTHLYCCGPRPLMQAVRDHACHWPREAVHFEDFGAANAQARAGETAFSVQLARSGITVQVPPGTSILAALQNRGIVVPCSCECGTCGSCQTTLLSGEAEHRDFILDEDEHDSQIIICVSRARSPELVLDL